MNNIEDIYPLSPMQQGLLFHSLYAPHSGVYVEQFFCTFEGRLDISAFKRAWQYVLDQQPTLRTLFVWEKREKPLQVVRRQVELPWLQQDWRDASAPEQQQRLQAYLEEDRQRGFALARAPLFRLALFQLTEYAYYFVLSHHHILVDGWSMSMLFSDHLHCYKAIKGDQHPTLKPRPPYRNYIAWLEQQDLKEGEHFWSHALSGMTAPTPLGLDYRSRSSQQAVLRVFETTFPAELTAQLQAFARQHQLTLSTIFQGMWAILLSHYSGEADVLFGMTVSGRTPAVEDVDSIVGLFVNTLPVRIKVSSNLSLIDWLQELQEQFAESRQYEYSPLVQIQGWSEIHRQLPLFDSLLVFENYPVDEALGEWDELLTIRDSNVHEQTNFPLSITFAPSKALLMRVEYDANRFTEEAIKRLAEHFHTLALSIIELPASRPNLLPILSTAESQLVLQTWNQTTCIYPEDACVHHLFEDQVQRTPAQQAVVCAGNSLSYQELNARANQLAHYLQHLGVGPEVLVGVYMERSLELLISLLAILKAGGAYVPLDPLAPAERLSFIMDDAQAPILLTLENLLTNLPASQARHICVDRDWESIAAESDSNPVSAVSALHTMAVIYTSGSTGRPKGAVLIHKGMVNHNLDFIGHYELHPGDRILQFCALGFDTMAEELFPALLSGATVVFRPNDAVLAIADFIRFVEKERITIIDLPTAYWHEWTLELEHGYALPPAAVRWVIIAGEKALMQRYTLWQRYVGKRTPFSNTYGPVEGTILSTIYEPDGEPLDLLLIGRPWGNVQTYVLDQDLQPVPLGIAGELYLGGASLARGYHQRPGLTAERFVPHPFSSRPGDRLYRTGDVVRYIADGNLEYVGRVDHQIKIRGFRVELGEIEATLRDHSTVRDAFVLLNEDTPGNKRLIAYLVYQDAAQYAPDELRRYLKSVLPDYMLPADFVLLESIPYNSNGKVDRQKLSEMGYIHTKSSEATIAPGTPVEKSLAAIWQEVLHVEDIGLNDNFFDLGGHSLVAIRLISQVRAAFQYEVPLRAIFEMPVLQSFATHVEQLIRDKEATGISPILDG